MCKIIILRLLFRQIHAAEKQEKRKTATKALWDLALFTQQCGSVYVSLKTLRVAQDR